MTDKARPAIDGASADLPDLRVTLCCDSSPNRHASAHVRSSTHPAIASAQPGEPYIQKRTPRTKRVRLTGSPAALA